MTGLDNQFSQTRIDVPLSNILPGRMSHQPDNIFAGTQVVSLIEVRGTKNSLVHPRCAVGVVTRTPTGDQNKFLVRFPDGFEASLTRGELDVLKHLKDRLPGRDTTAGFELDQFIHLPLSSRLACVRPALLK